MTKSHIGLLIGVVFLTIFFFKFPFFYLFIYFFLFYLFFFVCVFFLVRSRVLCGLENFCNLRPSYCLDIITKTRLYNFDPLKPHFYIVKLGFTGVYIIFLISAQNIDCGYSLEPPRRGGSNEYPQSMF